MRREPFEYTEWQRKLFKDVLLDILLNEVAQYREQIQKVRLDDRKCHVSYCGAQIYGRSQLFRDRPLLATVALKIDIPIKENGELYEIFKKEKH